MSPHPLNKYEREQVRLRKEKNAKAKEVRANQVWHKLKREELKARDTEDEIRSFQRETGY